MEVNQGGRKTDKVKSRVITGAVRELMEQSSKIFIMSQSFRI